jgi:hypothetical protein
VRARCTGTDAIPNFNTLFMNRAPLKRDPPQHKNH